MRKKKQKEIEGILNGMKMKGQNLRKSFGDATKSVLGGTVLVLKTLIRKKNGLKYWHQLPS